MGETREIFANFYDFVRELRKASECFKFPYEDYRSQFSLWTFPWIVTTMFLKVWMQRGGEENLYLYLAWRNSKRNVRHTFFVTFLSSN